MNLFRRLDSHPRRHLFLSPILILSFVLYPSAFLFSQTPPAGSKVEAEEEAFRRPREEIKPERKPLIEYAEREGAEEIPIQETSFYVEKIALEGFVPLKPEALERIISEYEGRTLTLSELREAARILTRAIRSKGYVTSRVYIPPQKIEQGGVTFKVLEGKLGKVTLRGHRRFKERLIRRHLSVRSGEILRYGELERDLLRLNAHPDREIRATLIPGEVPETTDLILDVKETFPVHIGYSFDNHGTRLTGRRRHGVTLAHSNLLARDDILQGRFVITDGGHFVGVSADYLFPLRASTELLLNYALVDTRLGGDFNDLKIRGEAHVYSFSLLQRLLDHENLEGSVFAGFDFKEIETTEDDRPNSRDNLRILRLGPQIAERDPWGRTYLTNEFSFGFDTFLGASDKIDVNSSRRGGGGQFFRSVLEFGRLQKLPFGWFALLRTAAHLTPDKLPFSEQMRVGGAETVRGYPEGEFLGERGLLQNIEIRIPSFFIPADWKFPRMPYSIREAIQFVGFFDIARVETKGAPQSQDANRTLAGVGGGLRFNLTRKVLGNNLTARIEWGYPVGDNPNTEERRARLHFTLSLSF